MTATVINPRTMTRIPMAAYTANVPQCNPPPRPVLRSDSVNRVKTATIPNMRPPSAIGVNGCNRNVSSGADPNGVVGGELIGRSSESGGMSLAQGGQPITKSSSVVGGQSTDLGISGRRRRVEFHADQPEGPFDRSGYDVNQLHASVRHDGELLEHCAVGDQQVFISLDVSPRPQIAADRKPHRHHEGHHDDPCTYADRDVDERKSNGDADHDRDADESKHGAAHPGETRGHPGPRVSSRRCGRTLHAPESTASSHTRRQWRCRRMSPWVIVGVAM